MPFKNKEDRVAYDKQYYLDNKEKRKAQSRQNHIDNGDKIRKRKRAYGKQDYINNPEKYVHKSAKRRAAKLQRTPSWADDLVIRMIYEDCPEGMHVDHIIPLQGELVSGLHVAWNLQYLTPEENLSKGNKFNG